MKRQKSKVRPEPSPQVFEIRPPSRYEYPEGWQRGEELGISKPVSYAMEQRILAAIVFMGGIIVPESTRRGTVVQRIHRVMAFAPKNANTLTSGLSQLEKKKLIVVEKTVTAGGGHSYRGISLRDDSVRPDSWAMKEIRELWEKRRNKAPKPVEAPGDWKPVDEALREIGDADKIFQTVVKDKEALAEPYTPREMVELPQVPSGDPNDLAAVADALLVQLMAKLTEEPKTSVTARQAQEVASAAKAEVKRLQAELKATRDHAYELEQRLKSLQGRAEQAEKNNDAFVQRVSQLSDNNERLQHRIREFETQIKAATRTQRLGSAIGPEGQKALEAMLNQMTEKK